MRVQLVFVSNADDTPAHGPAFDMPSVPRAGDWVTILRSGQAGSTSFLVRRIWWTLDYPDTVPFHRAGECVMGTTKSVTVECEFEVGSYWSEDHKAVAPTV